jgi:hypothetical protein
MASKAFELAIPAIEQTQTYTLDGTFTGIGSRMAYLSYKVIGCGIDDRVSIPEEPNNFSYSP